MKRIILAAFTIVFLLTSCNNVGTAVKTTEKVIFSKKLDLKNQNLILKIENIPSETLGEGDKSLYIPGYTKYYYKDSTIDVKDVSSYHNSYIYNFDENGKRLEYEIFKITTYTSKDTYGIDRYDTISIKEIYNPEYDVVKKLKEGKPVDYSNATENKTASQIEILKDSKNTEKELEENSKEIEKGIKKYDSIGKRNK